MRSHLFSRLSRWRLLVVRASSVIVKHLTKRASVGVFVPDYRLNVVDNCAILLTDVAWIGCALIQIRPEGPVHVTSVALFTTANRP